MTPDQYLKAIEQALLTYVADGDVDKFVRAVESALRAWAWRAR